MIGGTIYVRSFYWIYNNMLDEIKAECVYADPTAPYPKWYTDDSRENLKND